MGKSDISPEHEPSELYVERAQDDDPGREAAIELLGREVILELDTTVGQLGEFVEIAVADNPFDSLEDEDEEFRVVDEEAVNQLQGHLDKIQGMADNPRGPKLFRSIRVSNSLRAINRLQYDTFLKVANSRETQGAIESADGYFWEDIEQVGKDDFAGRLRLILDHKDYLTEAAGYIPTAKDKRLCDALLDGMDRLIVIGNGRFRNAAFSSLAQFILNASETERRRMVQDMEARKGTLYSGRKSHRELTRFAAGSALALGADVLGRTKSLLAELTNPRTGEEASEEEVELAKEHLEGVTNSAISAIGKVNTGAINSPPYKELLEQIESQLGTDAEADPEESYSNEIYSELTRVIKVAKDILRGGGRLNSEAIDTRKLANDLHGLKVDEGGIEQPLFPPEQSGIIVSILSGDFHTLREATDLLDEDSAEVKKATEDTESTAIGELKFFNLEKTIGIIRAVFEDDSKIEEIMKVLTPEDIEKVEAEFSEILEKQTV